MGKKRIIKKIGHDLAGSGKKTTKKAARRKLEIGVLYVRATYNNTIVMLTDPEGKAISQASSGGIGFKGSKKGTPFAASKVGELMANQGLEMGLKEAAVIIRGVGPGRESAVRAFASNGIAISSIQDQTPIPFNGPKAKKPRRN
ncbi:MAG: 30S ribosomal protein S11 [Candidatus Vogelbacteria bacterium CG10_big_fil_rev_8_21_14_0_10_50_13]|uniref:Small ribosomal subunit protein uS11 n=1 Tax=Candidatus Vogelbacteria bacterium CG10_big_fil_rev_8_21_14_0_10_50_13 TaxID=1975044 RepID=A0A2H0RH49_9BACT|nr:MAG: 30S ribosomal protein S11 [Candidatus Vogelbacteria bacterium CG10_big_fil_rev_8_21_14_0_10_50_13]